MAAPAALGSQIRRELGLHARFGVARGALLVAGEGGELSLGVELMAEGAVGAEPRFGIDAGFGIDVHGVGKLKQNRPRPFVAGKRHQIVGSGGRKRRMALFTDLLLQILIKVVGMAYDALVVSRPFEGDRTVFHRDVAKAALKAASELFFVKSVNVEIRLSEQRRGEQRQEGERQELSHQYFQFTPRRNT